MKDQYVGDVNDFMKYAFLRALAQGDLQLVVAWMLTADDGRTDGKRLGYLARPAEFRAIDPPLFDSLKRLVDSGARSVAAIERASLLSRSVFVADILGDSSEARAAYFDVVWQLAEGAPILFFDPDNGLEVRSVTKGRRNSAKYLYWDEVAEGYARGHSLVIYQHFPRRPRIPFLQDLSREICEVAACHRVLSVATPHVAFLTLPQQRHLDELTVRLREFARRAVGFAVAAEFERLSC